MRFLRLCVGCREFRDKSELIRVVLGGGGVSVDLSGKAAGRGAYVCKGGDCAKIALKRRALDKSFKTAVPKEIYEELIKFDEQKNGFDVEHKP